MLRNIKEITIGEGDTATKVIIKEVIVKDIISLFKGLGTGDDSGDMSITGFMDRMKKFLPLATDLKIEQAMELAPSQLKKVWEEFREVNSVFFELAQAMGLTDIVDRLRKTITEEFLMSYASSLKQDTLES